VLSLMHEMYYRILPYKSQAFFKIFSACLKKTSY